MVTFDNSANSPQSSPSRFLRFLFSTNHKVIGLNYLWLALFSVFLGMFLSLLMRIHLVWPSAQVPSFSGFGDAPGRYAALRLLHGSLMVFFVLTAAPQAGFGNFFLPLQIGAREVAFPRLNLLAFWATVVSLVGMTAAFFMQPAVGITLWVAGVALFCCSTLLNALNFSVTTIDLRAEGLTLSRLPLTVWAWFFNAILSLLIFSVLLAASMVLLSDLLLGTHFFSLPIALSSSAPDVARLTLPFLWQRLFWFFAQAEVYVAMLPCFGIASHLLSTFSRKPVWAERAVVLALAAVGLFGFCVWGQHIFAAGMNPYSPLSFALLAESLTLPAIILIASWLATLWNARVRPTTAMLFTLGFISLFLSGGLTGLFLAGQDLSVGALSDDFVTGHFHLVMGVAATFAILGALFFWFPKMFGRTLNETLGKWHFWLTFVGVYCVFMPMHWLGLMEHSSMALQSQLAMNIAAGATLRVIITAATLLTVGAQLLFVYNFFSSLFRGEKPAGANPWCATTLEWSVASPPPAGNFGRTAPRVFRGAYEIGGPSGAEDLLPQYLAPEQTAAVC